MTASTLLLEPPLKPSGTPVPTASDALTLVADPKGRIVSISGSESARRTIGFSLRIGDRLTSILSGSPEMDAWHVMDSALSRGTSCVIDFNDQANARTRAHTGRGFARRCYMRVLRARDGRPQGFVATVGPAP
ncbi:MAG: hypothetical protein AAGJ32_13280 [Pseudomonadota bacterium]